MKKTLFVMLLLIGAMALFVGFDQVADASEQQQLTTLQVTTKISEEWKLTGKQFLGAWSGYGAREATSCARCHDGLMFATQGVVLGTQDETYPDIRNNPTNDSLNGPQPERPHTMGVTCQACHSGLGKELMHAGSVESVSLGLIEGAGKGATCMACHDGRYAPSNDGKTAAEGLYKGYLAGGTGNLNLNGIHYAAAAKLVSNFGAMEYPDVTYPTGAHSNLDDSCVTCHMPTTNEGYSSHTFKRSFDNAHLQAACASCHSGINEQYVDSYQAELKVLVDTVAKEVAKQLGVEPNFGNNGFTLTKLDGTGTIEFTRQNVTLDQYVALYNLQLITSKSPSSYNSGNESYPKSINSMTRSGDGSYGVHNPVYARALLNESLKRLTAE